MVPKATVQYQAVIHTDGSCLKNPGGAGGFAAIVDGFGERQVLTGGESASTNNRMELMAAIVALESLSPRAPLNVLLYSDSKYLVDGMSQGWPLKWERNGWKTKKKAPVCNPELWKRLLAASRRHIVTWEWVRGHNGDRDNELCDTLALETAAMQPAPTVPYAKLPAEIPEDLWSYLR